MFLVLLVTSQDSLGGIVLEKKSDTFDVFKYLCTQLQREKDCGIVRIRSDHGTEFVNARFDEYCTGEGIKHEFSSPITPQ